VWQLGVANGHHKITTRRLPPICSGLFNPAAGHCPFGPSEAPLELSTRRPGQNKTFARVQAAAAVLCVFACGCGGGAQAAGELSTGSRSGLPSPRFVSLKPDRVNVRGGPTRDHDVAWVYTRAGLPVEVTAESENWRRIRDWEGAEGWVYHSMLTGRRTALVKAKEKDALVPLQAKPDASSEMVARLQSGVLGTVKSCTGTWCRIFGTGFDGWVAQERLWGVYPSEKVE
jgi:SH3-like domain-containing protein